MTTPMTTPVTFDSLGLPEKMSAALARMNYTTPTSIQAQAIPFAMQGRDVLGSAQTGTGKTAAFSIPMIAKLMEDPTAMALVLAPTRELAAQTLDVVHKLTSNNRDIRTALLIGGEAMGKQFEQLRQNPRVIIGTPGRINDHLRRNPRMLEKVNFIAVDEADRMLDMGFSEQIDDVFQHVAQQRQMLMFSATFPDSIIKFSRKYLNNPERVSVGTEKIDTPKIKHEMKRTTDGNKYTDLVAELVARDGSVIIFVKTQHGTERLSKRLEADNHDNVVIHGGLRQSQRDRAVRTFRAQKARIMVATDVAARGLDIPHIEHVINYDLPQVAEDYIHRIGRTARAGAEGNAMCFVTPSDGGKWNAINRIMNPGAEPIRTERGGRDGARGSSRDYRGGRTNNAPHRDGSGDRDRGFRKEGGGNFRKPNSDRPSWGQMKDRQRGDRPYGDRPKVHADRDGNKPFVKYTGGQGQGHSHGDRFGNKSNDRGAAPRRAPSDRNWNSKEDRGTYTRPKEYKPDWRDEGRGDGRMDNTRNTSSPDRGGDRGGSRGNDRGGDRNYAPRRDNDSRGNNGGGDRPRYDGNREGNGNRTFSRPSSGGAPRRDDRPRGDRPQYADKREGGSRDGARAPKPAKSFAVKKPFKFKEHSRKPGTRPGDREAV